MFSCRSLAVQGSGKSQLCSVECRPAPGVGVLEPGSWPTPQIRQPLGTIGAPPLPFLLTSSPLKFSSNPTGGGCASGPSLGTSTAPQMDSRCQLRSNVSPPALGRAWLGLRAQHSLFLEFLLFKRVAAVLACRILLPPGAGLVTCEARTPCALE